MIKNNKGFTLIELLAAIAVLSILMVLTLPQLTNVIGGNRNKIYVNDAKKMIALAEYKIRSNSTSIEKPDDGECIVFSLNYLDNDSFDSPPNRGDYLRYSSFVVAKNDNGNMEYSAILIEEYKNVYKGIKLTKEDDLNKRDAVKNITVFNSNELVYITEEISAKYVGESEAANKTIGINYINSYLGNNYVKAIDDRLVDDVVDDDGKVKNLSAPKIKSFTLVPDSSTFNSMNLTINVEAKDDDTPPEDLTVYYNVCTPSQKTSNPSVCNYPDITNPSLSGYQYSSGGSSTFTSSAINLSRCNNSSDYCASYGQEVVVYLIVKDKDGNFVKKQKSYLIHTNQPPKLKKFNISKRDQDPANFLKAKVTVEIDDEDGTQVQYCLTENENASIQNCTNFKTLTSSTFTYDFCSGDIYSASCLPDGSTKTLKIFIKDSHGEIATKTATYKVYKLNTETLYPTITINSAGSDTPTGENSLKVGYSIVVPFDPTSGITDNDVTYTLGVCENDITCNTPLYLSDSIPYSTTKTGTYNMYNNNFPIYNGVPRRLIARVYVSKYGLNSDSYNFSKIVKYIPYVNNPPEIDSGSSDSFTSLTDNFPNHKTQSTGTYNVKYNFSGTDDIDKKDFWTCLSEAEDGCNFSNETEFTSKFTKGSQNINYTFNPINSALPYDGSRKKLYIKMCDKYYLTSGIESCTDASSSYYDIYENQEPIIEEYDANLISTGEGGSQIEVTLKVDDDLDSAQNLMVTLSNGVESVIDSYGNMFDSNNKAIVTLGVHEIGEENGTLIVTVSDSYSASAEESIVYSSEVNTFTVNQGPMATEVPTIEPDYTNLDDEIKNAGIHVNKIIVKSNFVDDNDTQDSLTVRVGYRKIGESKFIYTEEQQFNKELIFTIGNENFKYDGSTYEIVIQAKDKAGKYSETPAVTTYKVYNDTAPVIVDAKINDKCDSDTGCKVITNVKDYFDTFNICISDNSTTCNDYTTDNFSGNNSSLDSQSLSYRLSNKNLYLYIKDSYGNITKQELSYNISKTCQDKNMMVESNIVYTPKDNNKAISPISCNGLCYRDSDDERKPERQFSYIKTFDLMDLYVSGHLCQSNLTKEEKLYCSYESCFYNSNGQPSYWLIGDNVNFDIRDDGEQYQYTYFGSLKKLNNKMFVKYHKVYKLEKEMVNGSINYVFKLYPDIKIPHEIIGMPDYNYKTYFPFDANNDSSYLVFDD